MNYILAEFDRGRRRWRIYLVIHLLKLTIELAKDILETEDEKPSGYLLQLVEQTDFKFPIVNSKDTFQLAFIFSRRCSLGVQSSCPNKILVCHQRIAENAVNRRRFDLSDVVNNESVHVMNEILRYVLFWALTGGVIASPS